MNKIITVSIRVLLAIAFIGSAALKLFPVEPFELSFIDLGIAGWSSAPIIARVIIGAEFFLGVLLLMGIAFKKFTIPAAFFLLIVFTAHLLIQLIKEGNEGDCGCFGIYLPMTPLQSIIKNVVLMLLLFLLWKFSNRNSFRYQTTIAVSLGLLSFSLPFILNPVEFLYLKHLQPESVNYELPKDLILEKNKFGPPPVDLFTGKRIISFMTLSCPHCRQAALKIHVINKRHPEIPFFIFLNGKDELLDDFFSATKTQDIPHMKMNAEPFSKLTGGSWPQIWWVDNGVVVKKSVYYTLKEDDLLQWVNLP